MAAKKSAGVFVGWARPDFETTVKTNKNFKRNFHGAMLFAHYELTASELKKEVYKYLKGIDAHHPYLEKIKDMHENRFTTVGKYMYILNHGGDIPDNISAGLLPALEKVINEETAKATAIAKEIENIRKEEQTTNTVPGIAKPVITIQDRLKEKARQIAAEVEGWLDDFTMDTKSSIKSVDDFIGLFKSNDLKAPHMPHIRAVFERRTAEFISASAGKDAFLVESYSNFTKADLKKLVIMMRNLFAACEMMQEVAKVERAPRIKKVASSEKIVSKLKFKKEDSTLGIVSMNPTHILGSREVWIYNTKTRKLAQYKAVDERGLGIKGASLLNFSADSVEKTVRKPAETLAEFKKASKVKLRTFLKDIATVDIPAGGKLNEHHIILRIDK